MKSSVATSSNTKTKNLNKPIGTTNTTTSILSPPSNKNIPHPSASTQPSSNYHILDIQENMSNNPNNNNNNNMIPNNPMGGDDPMLMMQMLQQYMQMNGNPQATSTNAPTVDPMMMMKMLQMFSGGGIQQPHVSTLLLTPPPPSSSSLPQSSSSSSQNRSNNRPSSPTRSPSPPPRPSSPTIIQQEDDTGVPPDILAQKYNLVEKKKRKMRCGKKRGPQEEFIFHLKLEQDKKKKRRSAAAAAAANNATASSSTVATSIAASIPPSNSSSSITTTGKEKHNSTSSLPSSSSKASTSSATPPSTTSYPPPPPSSMQKKTSSSSIGGTELKTKQRKTTKKIQEAASGRSSKASSSEDVSESTNTTTNNTTSTSTKENHPILPPTTQPSSLPLPMSTSNPSLSSITVPMSTNFINNIPSDITSLLMPKLTPSSDNFLGNDELESWQDIPQFTNNITMPEFSSPYPTLQQKPKGCYYGDKSKGKKVHKVPINQSSSRLQIINNRKKTSVIGSIIDILSDDTSITNHTIPSMVTLLDGFIVKVNEAMKDMLGYNSVNDIEFQSNLQNFLHPQDIIKHDILLLQMLSTNSDSCKHIIKFVNRNGKCAPLSTEFCCIRNEMGLPQWIVIRLTNPNMKLTNIEEHHTEILPLSHMNTNKSDYDMNLISREALINDSPLTFQDMFLKILERLFGSKQPTCFYDKSGYIIWNNERFDMLFSNPRKNFFGRRVYDIPEMKGTIMEILSNSVLVDFPDKLEAQMSPDEHSMNSFQLFESRLKMNCYGQKVTENSGTVFGYVWMFSVIREDNTIPTQPHHVDNNYPVNQEEDMFENGDFFQ